MAWKKKAIILLYLLFLSSTICCSLQEVHFLLCATLSQMMSWSLSFIQGLPHVTPDAHTVLLYTLIFHLLPSGGPWRTVNSPETMDILPQGQAALLPTRVQLPLQHTAQRLRPARPYTWGHTLLRHLWLGLVSIDGLFEDANANEAIINSVSFPDITNRIMVKVPHPCIE